MDANASGQRATLTVVLLCLLAAISFIDRMILALLMAPIRADLGVSDGQLALLFGLGFALCYIAAGIPLAHLADRGNRKHLLVGGVLMWSTTTFASAFTWDFASLLVARAGVAIGEAVLMPIAISMIADLYPPSRRTLPTSIYLMVGAVMGQGALIVGGGAVALAEWASGPLGLATWRLTFIIVAIPGVLVALLFAALLSEPPRGDAGQEEADEAISLRAAIRHLFRHSALYLGMFVGVGFILSAAIGMIAWVPTMLVREHGLPLAQAGLTYGLPALLGAIGGTMSVPPLLRRLQFLPRVQALVTAAFIFMALVPVAALTVSAASLPIVMAGIGLSSFGISAVAVLSPLLVQAVTPPRFRARLVAVYLTIMTLLSQGLGPSLVTTLGAASPGTSLSVSIARTIWLVLALATLCLVIAMTATRRSSDALEEVLV